MAKPATAATTQGRVTVAPDAAFRRLIEEHRDALGLPPNMPFSRALLDLAREGYRTRLARAEEAAMEQVYHAWADDAERDVANAFAEREAVASGIL